MKWKFVDIKNVCMRIVVYVSLRVPPPPPPYHNHGGIIMERPRGVNCIKTGGGSALCTLHRGEGLYGQVRFRGYVRDS